MLANFSKASVKRTDLDVKCYRFRDFSQRLFKGGEVILDESSSGVLLKTSISEAHSMFHPVLDVGGSFF